AVARRREDGGGRERCDREQEQCRPAPAADGEARHFRVPLVRVRLPGLARLARQVLPAAREQSVRVGLMLFVARSEMIGALSSACRGGTGMKRTLSLATPHMKG